MVFSPSMRLIWLLRIVLIAFLLVFFLYYMSDDVQIWCRERYGAFENLPDILPGYNLDIPAEKRHPDVSIREFYADREGRIRRELIETRMKFKAQPFVGSVMTDGFHSDLPLGTKWEGGTIVGGEKVKNELARMTEYSKYMEKQEVEQMNKEAEQLG